MEQNLPAETVTMPQSLFMDMQRFEAAQRVASLLAQSSLVPTHFQKSVANCVIALNLAARLRVDPFMLMQNIYVVHGRPGIEGKLAIALVEGTGRFSALKFKMTGQGKTASGIQRADSCTAYATEIKTSEVIEGPPVSWEMAVAEGWTKPKGTETSKWQTMPDLMFRYRSAMFFARVNCPGALLGLQSSDEIEDIGNTVTLQKGKNGSFSAPDPEPEDKTDPAEILKAFDESIPKDIDPAILAEFLTRTAESNKPPETVDAVKIEAMKKPAAFWKIYKAYEKQTKAKQAKEGKTQGTEELAPAPCPEDTKTTYLKSHCNVCASRQVCKVW